MKRTKACNAMRIPEQGTSAPRPLNVALSGPQSDRCVCFYSRLHAQYYDAGTHFQSAKQTFHEQKDFSMLPWANVQCAISLF